MTRPGNWTRYNRPAGPKAREKELERERAIVPNRAAKRRYARALATHAAFKTYQRGVEQTPKPWQPGAPLPDGKVQTREGARKLRRALGIGRSK